MPLSASARICLLYRSVYCAWLTDRRGRGGGGGRLPDYFGLIIIKAPSVGQPAVTCESFKNVPCIIGYIYYWDSSTGEGVAQFKNSFTRIFISRKIPSSINQTAVFWIVCVIHLKTTLYNSRLIEKQNYKQVWI